MVYRSGKSTTIFTVVLEAIQKDSYTLRGSPSGYKNKVVLQQLVPPAKGDMGTRWKVDHAQRIISDYSLLKELSIP